MEVKKETIIATMVEPQTGNFILRNVPEGVYVIVAGSLGYLPAQREVTVEEGITTSLPPVTLLGGDVNRDGRIDIYDLTLSGANFDKTGSPWAD